MPRDRRCRGPGDSSSSRTRSPHDRPFLLPAAEFSSRIEPDDSRDQRVDDPVPDCSSDRFDTATETLSPARTRPPARRSTFGSEKPPPAERTIANRLPPTSIRVDRYQAPRHDASSTPDPRRMVTAAGVNDQPRRRLQERHDIAGEHCEDEAALLRSRASSCGLRRQAPCGAPSRQITIPPEPPSTSTRRRGSDDTPEPSRSPERRDSSPLKTFTIGTTRSLAPRPGVREREDGFSPSDLVYQEPFHRKSGSALPVLPTILRAIPSSHCGGVPTEIRHWAPQHMREVGHSTTRS